MSQQEENRETDYQSTIVANKLFGDSSCSIIITFTNKKTFIPGNKVSIIFWIEYLDWKKEKILNILILHYYLTYLSYFETIYHKEY